LSKPRVEIGNPLEPDRNGKTIAVRRLILPLLLLILASTANTQSNKQTQYDLVIYGGAAAAVTAAVQAKQMGKTVIIVSPDKHLGGLSSGGLGFTDTGNKAVIGGLAREFYHRVYQHYQKPEAWNWERREQYGRLQSIRMI
jgi:hypothetical protein